MLELGGREDNGTTRQRVSALVKLPEECRRQTPSAEDSQLKMPTIRMIPYLRFCFSSELKSNVGYISEVLVMKPVQILQLQARMSWHRPIGGLISTAARVPGDIPSLCSATEVTALSLDPPGPTAVGAEQRAVATLTGVDRALPPVGPPGHPCGQVRGYSYRPAALLEPQLVGL